MSEVTIMGETLCPWCDNAMDIMRSGKTGYHYANCRSCNGHFRNIPVVMIDLEQKETVNDPTGSAQPESTDDEGGLRLSPFLMRYLQK